MNTSPVQAEEEPPNLKNPNQRRRKLGRIAWDLAGSAFKLWDFGQLVVSERKSKSFCQDKNRLRGQKYPQMI